MSSRLEIIEKIGKDYLTCNLENDGEFSYVKAGIPLKDIPKNENGVQNYKLDIRFENPAKKLSILVETIGPKPSKNDIEKHEKKLLESYCSLENKIRPENDQVLILSLCDSKNISVWKKKAGEKLEPLNDTELKSIRDYEKYFIVEFTNDEIQIKTSVLKLNELLHKNGISEDIRGQFVGTCLLALKDKDFRYKEKINNDDYEAFETTLIIQGIKDVINKLLNDEDTKKRQKIELLDTNILNNQKVRILKKENFKKILDFIVDEIIPFINTNTSQGQDLLNLFFTTFNKYVGKKDKNQAFTPDHITHFMCKVAEVNKNSKVLDPTCGSGSFIVQALIQELNECETDEEKDKVRKENIYGIENEEKAFGLSTTNMLIHGDGNSNIKLEEHLGCFGLRDWIIDKDIDVVLMNPPYNTQPSKIPPNISNKDGIVVYTVHKWDEKQNEGKSEPTKGFCFVNYIADCIGKNKYGELRKGMKLACLLPLSCAIGSNDVMKYEKTKILENNTLEAVFTLPAEIFYPGASANACCMLFTIGIPHYTKKIDKNGEEKKCPRKATFLGYFKDDGFVKRKNIGRISKITSDNQSLWEEIETYWLDLFYGNKTDKYLAVKKKITDEDEWLAEAYIKTDYSKLTELDFREQLQKYFAYLVGHGYDFYDKLNEIEPNKNIIEIDTQKWVEFKVENYFDVCGTKTTKLEVLQDEYGKGDYPYVTTQATNNGVAGYYDCYTEEGNVLVADSAAAGFVSYQAENFSASDHTEKLIPKKEKFVMNKYHAMFLVTVLNCENYRYSYGRKFNQDNIKNTFIKLPAAKKENGTYEPDWQYMENYIKSLPYADLI